jgi:hypothetical protein
VTSVNGTATSVDNAQVTVGSTVQFTLVATGLTPGQAGYSIVDTYPAGMTLIAVDPAGTPINEGLGNPGPATATMPNNTADGSGTLTRVLTFQITGGCGTTLVNSATWFGLPAFTDTASVTVVCP